MSNILHGLVVSSVKNVVSSVKGSEKVAVSSNAIFSMYYYKGLGVVRSIVKNMQ